MFGDSESKVTVNIPGLERFLDRIICGDSSKILKELPDESINMVVSFSASKEFLT